MDKRPLKVECALCGQLFRGSIAKLARDIMLHWNGEHWKELEGDFTAFYTETIERHHIFDRAYAYDVYRWYITSFDVVAVGEKYPFDLRYAKPGATPYCEDCWKHLPDRDGRVRMEGTDPPHYLCPECYDVRVLEQRITNNQTLHSFERK